MPRPTSRIPIALAALLVAGLLASIPLTAQESAQYGGRRIAEVRLIGNDALTREDLLFYLGLEEGETYDPPKVNTNVKDLWQRGLIDDIDIAVEPSGDSEVVVEITVDERPLLYSIDYQGLKKLKRADIESLIDRKRLNLYEGLTLSQAELARFEHEIENLYAEKGYRFADATVQIERVSNFEQRALVIIDEGNKVKIGKVSFDGNEVFKQGKLRSSMKKTKKTNLITNLRNRDVYSPATLEEDLDNVRGLYHNSGYKNLVVGEPQNDVLQKGKPDDEGKRRLEIIVPLEEGERWKLGDVLVEGNEVLPDQFLTRAIQEPKGGWLRQDVIEEGVEQIREFYSNTGYMFANVEHEFIERDDLIADVMVTVDEGDQYRVGRIEFEGNDRTRDRVLRRSLSLHESMVFNAASVKNSVFRVNRLDYFKLNEEEPVGFDIEEEDQTVNLQFKGDEAERTELTFGGGYSEIDGFFAQGGVRSRNFLGRGETLSFQIQTGRYREQFDVSYFVPWLFDRPQNVGLQLFNSDLDFDLLAGQRFLRKEKGAVLTYQRVIGQWGNVSFSYTNRDIDDFRSFTLFQPDPDSDLDPTIESGFEFSKSALTVGWTYDRRDSGIQPKRGRRLNFSVEYSGGPLGGDDYSVRAIGGATLFKNIRIGFSEQVAALNIEAGKVVPFGELDDGSPRELFFLNRFFMGGEQSVRGYNFRSIWVRDFETGETLLDEFGFPQGGDKFIQLNLEYQFVLNDTFRIVPFLDAGNVFGEQQDYDLGHLRYTGGLELRINVPIFGAPLRFIYATNLDPYDDLPPNDQERFESFDFSIGTSF